MTMSERTLVVTICLIANYRLFGVGFSNDFSFFGGAVYDGGKNDYASDVAVDTISAGGPYIYAAGRSFNVGGSETADFF